MESDQKAYEAALQLYEEARSLYAEFEAAQGAGSALIRAERGQSLRTMVPLALEEHWKSQNEPGMTAEDDHWKFYVVNGLKPTWQVDYVGLYRPNAGKPFERSLLDPEEGFLMPVDRPKWEPHPYVGPRFRLIRTLDPQQCELLIREALRIAECPTRDAALGLISEILAHS